MIERKQFIHYLPVFGCMATGIIYLGIGVIALMSFFQLREGGADESSMLMVLNDFIVGKIIIVIILLGTACYIFWRLYETITDPYQYGKNLKGLARRSGIALSSVADMLIVYTAVRVLLGVANIQTNGQPLEEREMTRTLLENGRAWTVITIGCITIGTALVQLLYGITKGYKERVNADSFNKVMRMIFNGLGLAGYMSRGIVLGIIGFFFLQAGFLKDPDVVVNTDKAFDFIGDHIGHIFFILIALGTIGYGLFMFALGVTYKPRRTQRV